MEDLVFEVLGVARGGCGRVLVDEGLELAVLLDDGVSLPSQAVKLGAVGGAWLLKHLRVLLEIVKLLQYAFLSGGIVFLDACRVQGDRFPLLLVHQSLGVLSLLLSLLKLALQALYLSLALLREAHLSLKFTYLILELADINPHPLKLRVVRRGLLHLRLAHILVLLDLKLPLKLLYVLGEPIHFSPVLDALLVRLLELSDQLFLFLVFEVGGGRHRLGLWTPDRVLYRAVMS